VHSMDRLARNLEDLHQLVQKLVKRGEFAERQRF
jgi:DNA invertase Pin-like site-specific DNA recombinase